MIVIGDRSAEHRSQTIAQFFADDATKLSDSASHGGKGRLQPRYGLFGLKLGDQARGCDHVSTKDRHKSSLAIRIGPLMRRLPASGARITIRIRRVARQAKHVRTSKDGRISAQNQLCSLCAKSFTGEMSRNEPLFNGFGVLGGVPDTASLDEIQALVVNVSVRGGDIFNFRWRRSLANERMHALQFPEML
jgi:hypothetical protein